MLKTRYIKIKTRGNTDIVNITPHIEKIVKEESIKEGIIFLNVIGSTAAITTMEYESGQIKDLKRLFEELIPYREDWAHNFSWGDENAHSHLRSSFIKTNFFIPVTGGKLDLGVWQQVVLIDFDIRARERTIVVKILS